MENYTICNCQNVTVCGGCHGQILDAISEIMDK